MEEKYLLSTHSHEDWRNYLIVNSFFFDTLIKYLRARLEIPTGGFKDLHMMDWEASKLSAVRKEITPKSRGNKSGSRIVKELLATSYATRRVAYAPIWEIIEEFADLNLSYSLLHTYALGLTGMSFLGSSRVFMVTSPENPIEETGIYIKYTPDLSKADITRIIESAQGSYETLSRITQMRKVKLKQRKKSVPTKSQLKMYTAIEEYLKQNYSDRPDVIKMQIVFDEVAKTLGKNPSSLQRSYYVLVDNFQLPTSVHTKKISKLKTV